MLWGSALAVGAECARRYADRGQATGAAITTTRRLVASFSQAAGSLDCRDLTGTDFLSRLQMARYLLFRAWRCFGLAERWAPEAIRTATEGLAAGRDEPPPPATSCATQVARRMGATDQQAIMVAGFAGGLGLSGHGCGALGAAVWLNTLAWSRRPENAGAPTHDNPSAARTLETFRRAAGGETRCDRLTGRRFETVEAHSAHVRSGGCEPLLDALARSA